MHIAHFINNLRGGGAQNLVVSLANCQREQGHTVSVIIVDRLNSDYEGHLLSGLREHAVTVVELNRQPGQKSLRGWLTTMRRLSAALTELQPDILNSHLEMCHLLSLVAWHLPTTKRAAHARRLATVHNAPEQWAQNPRASFLARGLFWRVLNRFTPRIYCSDAARKCEAGWNGKWATVPNGVTPVFPPAQLAAKKAAFCRQFAIPDSALIVVTVASIRAEKNHAAAVRAIAEFRSQSSRPVHYVVCGGEGTGSAALIDAIREAGLTGCVHLVGVRQDVREILFFADCYLSASLREGLPLSVLEALFAGLPCVLSAIKPHQDLVRQMPGCCLAALEPAALASAMKQVLSHGGERHALDAQRAPHLREYTAATCASRYVQFYETLLNHRRTGSAVCRNLALEKCQS